MADLGWYYDEDPIGPNWHLFEWVNMPNMPVGGGWVFELVIRNDANVLTNPHDHIFLSFKTRSVNGIAMPDGIHKRLKAGESKTWLFPYLGSYILTGVWIKSNTGPNNPVPKRIEVFGIVGAANVIGMS